MCNFNAIYKVDESSTYQDILNQVNNVNVKLKQEGISMPSDGSLKTTRRLYELLGSPLDSIPTVHIGGTNGKGTTCWKVAKCTQSAGIKTGLFVSPHIISFRERIQIANELIPKSDFVKLMSIVMNTCAEHSIPATVFELTFALACITFREFNCECVVLEVGLDGRLDATNVVQTALSVICSVALDHTRILDNTIEQRADVKDGIFKNK